MKRVKHFVAKNDKLKVEMNVVFTTGRNATYSRPEFIDICAAMQDQITLYLNREGFRLSQIKVKG